MKDAQENKLTMYRVAELLLNDNSIIWNSVPAFTTAKGAFSNKITAINSASQQQQMSITGIATDKKELKGGLANIATPVAGAVKAFAAENNDNQLRQEVNFTRAELMRTRDDLLGPRCQIIHDRANSNLAALAAYGITASVLSTLQTSINTYLAKVPSPGTAQAVKKANTLAIATLFKETDKLLKLQLDNLMEQFQIPNVDFYNAYKAAREIKDLGGKHTRLKVFVKDQNGSALEGVVTSLIQNNLVIYFGTTDAEGRLVLSKIKAGFYTVKTEKLNYLPELEAGVKFKPGRVVARTFTLVPGVVANPGNGIVVREGDLPMGVNANIDMTGINGTPTTTITIEATDAPMRVYAATSIGSAPGMVFIDVLPGTLYSKSAAEFALALGMNDTNRFLMVLNTGATGGHYKFTFKNVG